jgi:anti-sigma regulatory factor (Ser/Thr protein kinase)
LSSLAGFLVVLTHFTKRDRVLHFTREGLCAADLRDVILCGIPSLISFGSQALRGICFNTLLTAIAGSWAVAALSVANSSFSIILAVSQGMVTATSTICSLLYGEEDRKGLSQALGLSLRTVCAVFALIAAVLLVFAQSVAGLFLVSSAGEELNLAAQFIRMMALQSFLGSVSFSLSGAYQGTRRLNLNYLIDTLREGVFPVLTITVLGNLFGLSGFKAGFVAAGLLVLLSCLLIPRCCSGSFTLSPEKLLLLPAAFGPKPEELFETSIHNMEEVMAASLGVMQFCSQRGASKRISMMTSLFVEEMAGNIVQHGFRDRHPGSIDLRLIYRNGSQVIRLRDNGVPFDPVEWLRRNHPEDPASGVGLRIIIGLAKDVQYLPAMNLNHFMITIS